MSGVRHYQLTLEPDNGSPFFETCQKTFESTTIDYNTLESTIRASLAASETLRKNEICTTFRSYKVNEGDFAPGRLQEAPRKQTVIYVPLRIGKVVPSDNF